MVKKFKVNGPIISNSDKWIYDYWEMEATCPKDVIDNLPVTPEDVEITINSYGGLVDSGNEIYTALRGYSGNITINIVMAGSAASIIAMAGDKVLVSPVGQIMIHNVSMGSYGDHNDMDKASEILVKANSSLANAYVSKTGKPKDEILALMEDETWLTADEAVQNGFADGVMFEENDRSQLVASFGNGMIPNNVINEFKKLKFDSDFKEKENEQKEKVDALSFEDFAF